MSAQELENRKGCNKRVVLFFVFTIAVVAAFLIIGLVNTCERQHEESEEIVAPQDDVVMISSQPLNLFA